MVQKSQVIDNQYKLLFALSTIGYSGVSGAQLLRSLEIDKPALIWKVSVDYNKFDF